MESTDSTKSVIDPAVAANPRTNDRPAASIEPLIRLRDAYILLSPRRGPVGSRSHNSLARIPRGPSAVPPPGQGVPSTTLTAWCYDSRRGGSGGWGAGSSVPRFGCILSDVTSGGETA